MLLPRVKHATAYRYTTRGTMRKRKKNHLFPTVVDFGAPPSSETFSDDE